MAMINQNMIDAMKNNLNEAQRTSHFMIIQYYDPDTQSGPYMITNYSDYIKIMKKRAREQKHNFQLIVVRDIVPVNDDLARWAIEEQQLNMIGSGGNVSQKVQNVNKALDKVLMNNKIKN
ncbi:hypothetical protein WR164_00130 [Philodulcilactobacillus myokoensis]|uniref:Uncharacterized protein n=1 Tax=Philodulcilactobacillus myokoensis TaxID=2929573 RepID=A0A9W6B0R2_9LACO|nr:hypothetical protein [Philodulcilactobacillus myokoensis]GLB46034.1 hypothetical protein WR164_00130 [Philodulcilactobacillus myokoensis]